MTDDDMIPRSEAQMPERVLDIIGELGREAYLLLDDCEESGPVETPLLTVTTRGVHNLSTVLDKVDSLPYTEPGVILGTGAKLQAAIKTEFVARSEAMDMVAAAYEDAADASYRDGNDYTAELIRARTPADALAALDRAKQEARRGEREKCAKRLKKMAQRELEWGNPLNAGLLDAAVILATSNTQEGEG